MKKLFICLILSIITLNMVACTDSGVSLSPGWELFGYNEDKLDIDLLKESGESITRGDYTITLEQSIYNSKADYPRQGYCLFSVQKKEGTVEVDNYDSGCNHGYFGKDKRFFLTVIINGSKDIYLKYSEDKKTLYVLVDFEISKEYKPFDNKVKLVDSTTGVYSPLKTKYSFEIPTE